MGFFSRFLKRKAFDQPRQASDPPGLRSVADLVTAIQRAFMVGHVPTQWGSDHLEELRHFSEWQYIAVHAMAKQFALAKCCVYDSPPMSKGYAPDEAAPQRKPNEQHPLALRMKKPNPMTQAKVFQYQIGQQIGLTGGAYIWEVRNRMGGPHQELWVLPRGWLYPQRPTHDHPVGWFRCTPAVNTWTSSFTAPSALIGMSSWPVDARELIRVGWPDPLVPGEFTSPLHACRRLIDISEQTETAVWSSFVKSVNPSVIVNILNTAGGVAGPVSEELIKQIQDQLKQKAGANNRGEAIVTVNSTVEPWGATPAELAYVEGRNQNREFSFNVQGVPGIATGSVSETAYAALAVALKGWIELQIQPSLDIMGGAYTHRWQSEYGDDFECAFNAKNYDDPTLNLQRADSMVRAKGSGVKFSDNEIRASYGLPPIPGGDAYLDPPPKEPFGIKIHGSDSGKPSPFGGGKEDMPNLDHESGDDDGPNMRQPEQQESSGNRLPRWLLNGSN